jgi:hypothetical protein
LPVAEQKVVIHTQANLFGLVLFPDFGDEVSHCKSPFSVCGSHFVVRMVNRLGDDRHKNDTNFVGSKKALRLVQMDENDSLTFRDFPPQQKPGSFTIDDALAKMAEAGGGR